MIRRKRLALALGGALAVLVILASVAAVVTSKLGDATRLRARVASALSRQLHGSVTIRALRLSLLPLPHAVLNEVRLSIPGAAEARINSVSVYPKLLSLLRGRLQLATIYVDAPDATLQFPSRQEAGAAGAASLTELRERAAAASAQAPGLTVVVQGGRVRLIPPGTRALSFTDVRARLRFPPQRLDVDLTCASTLWDRLSVSATLAPMRARVDATATDVDVASTRDAATFLAGQVPAVRKIFAVLQAGRVSRLTVHSEATAVADLGGRDALVIRGTLADGRVHVPGVDLDLDEVSGDASVTGGVLAGDGIAARLGNSRARDGALRLGLSGAAPELRVDTTVEADAAELPALLKRLVGGALARELDRVTDAHGMAVGKLVLNGTTRDVSVTADVSHVKLSAHTPGLQDPLHIAGGRVAYSARRIAATDLTVTAGGSALSQLSFSVDWTDTPASVAATATDSRLVLGEVYPWLVASGWLGDTAWSPQALTGTLVVNSVRLSGPATAPAQWQFKLAGAARDLDIDSPLLRQRIALRYPVSFSGVRVARDATGSIAFSGTLAAAGDLTAAVDLVWNPQALRVNRLSVRDAESHATVSLFFKPPEIDLAFDGNLSRATLAAVVPENHFLGGWVRGKFQTRIFIDQPGRSTADGRLEASDVFLPAHENAQLRAETLSLDARGGTLALQAALVAGAESRLQVVGSVTPSPPAFVADLDVSTGHLDWAAIEPFLLRNHAGGGSPAASALSVPLRGVLRVAADSFTYGRFTWKPLQATVDLLPAGTTVTVTEANLCGIATPGEIAVAPGGLDLTVRPHAKQAQLDQTMACLAAEKGLITGQYTLTGSVTAHGQPAEIAKSLRGHLTFDSTRGRIHRAQMAKTLLSVLSIATGSVYSLADVTKQGLAYDHMALKGDLDRGTLRLKEAILDGPSAMMVGEGSVDMIGQTVDLTLLVAPLKTVDSIVSWIPLVGDVLGNTLVSIPVKISGDLSAPQVTPIAVSAVGDRLLGIMERTVKLPVKILEPLLPERK
jgi:hypothetical protein